jgi:hypothetical protein
MSDAQQPLWSDERIEGAILAKAQAIVNQGNTVRDYTFWMERARQIVTLEMRDEYEAKLAQQEADKADSTIDAA